jgi:hypothetical protein
LTITPVSARFVGPPDAGAVVGAPRPDVVEDRVVGVDHEAVGRQPGLGPADPEEHVLDERRVVRAVRLPGPALTEAPATRANDQQRRRVLRAGVEDHPRHLDPGDIGGLHRDLPVLGN